MCIRDSDNLGRIEFAFAQKQNCEPIISKIKLAVKNNQLPKNPLRQNIDSAFNQHIITLDEKKSVIEMLEACYDAILVDEYTLENYKKIGG